MNLSRFVGQSDIKADLLIHIRHSIETLTPLDHAMFYGMPGLGKTTIANAAAEELGVKIYQKTGQEVDKESIIWLLNTVLEYDIIFIDEVHNASKKAMELLYGPLQIINNAKLARFVPSFVWEGINIEPFTLLAATTSAGKVLKPLRDRIVLAYKFEPYPLEDLAKILINKGCPPEAAISISYRARGVPRIALNYFIRIRNEVIQENKITPEICENIFRRLGIDKNGFLTTDIQILKFLKQKSPLSEARICNTLGIDLIDYKEMYEPFLLSTGMIEIGGKGREISKEGILYLKGK